MLSSNSLLEIFFIITVNKQKLSLQKHGLSFHH